MTMQNGSKVELRFQIKQLEKAAEELKKSKRESLHSHGETLTSLKLEQEKSKDLLAVVASLTRIMGAE